MFEKMKQRILLAILKTQAKKLAKMATVQLESMNADVTAEAIVSFAETAIKGYCGFQTPEFADKIADKAVATILDKVRDEAVVILEKAQ